MEQRVGGPRGTVRGLATTSMARVPKSFKYRMKQKKAMRGETVSWVIRAGISGQVVRWTEDYTALGRERAKMIRDIEKQNVGHCGNGRDKKSKGGNGIKGEEPEKQLSLLAEQQD